MGSYLEEIEKKIKSKEERKLKSETEKGKTEKEIEKEKQKSVAFKLDLTASEKSEIKPKDFFVRKSKLTLEEILGGGVEDKKSIESERKIESILESKKEVKKSSESFIEEKPKVGIESILEKRTGEASLGLLKSIEKIETGKISGKSIEEGKGYKVVRNKGEKIATYIVSLPALDEKDKNLIKQIESKAISQLDLDPEAIANYAEKKKIFLEKVKEFIETNYPDLSRKKIHEYTNLIVQDMIGYGLLDPLISDDNLEEIMLVGRNIPVFVYHRKHGMCKTNIVFDNDDDALKIINRIARAVGRRVDASTPLLDARLKDGSRVNATVPPVSLDGPTLTIRKFKADPFTIVDILNFKTMSLELAAFLWLAVEGYDVKPANILVSGGTGSGKTTTLNCLGSFIPETSRVISIEDTAELQLPVKHWVRLETRPPNLEGKGEISMETLLKNTLRMRPDRIIVGEVRGKEANTLLAAMNTGQSGCMGTLHANNARETITRLTSAPMNVPLIMIPSLNLIIMQNRFSYKGKTVRRITEVAEISGLQKDEVLLNNIFEWDPRKDEVVPTGAPSKIKHILAELRGVSLSEIEEEIKRRKKVLEYMVKNNIKGIKNVGRIINEYYINKERLLEKIEGREYEEKEEEAKDKTKEKPVFGVVKLFDVEEVEKEIIEKYDSVALVRYENEKNPVYEVALPKISKEEKKILKEAGDKAIEKVQISIDKIENREEAEKIFSEVISKFLKEKIKGASQKRIKELTKVVVDSLIGYSFLEPLLKDENLEEIMVIGANRPVYVNHARFGICRTNIVFDEDEDIEHIIEKIASSVGRRIDKSTPLLDARLKDGSRVNATIPPISIDGPTITIRKFKADPFTMIDLIKFNTITLDAAAFLWVAVEGMGIKPANILVGGGAGSGKTTLLNSLCSFIPETERVISIEDTAELKLSILHWVRLETKPPSVEGKGEVTMDDLVKNTLRMRPDRIIVGEVRGSEARTLFTAMNTGHDGCMGTLHANNARETITKLINPPMNVPPIMLPALDIVVMEQKIYHEGETLRRITEIAEIAEAHGEEDGTVTINTTYQWNPKKDILEKTGVPSIVKQKLAKLTGKDLREIDKEIERRKMILEYMVKNNIRSVNEVGRFVNKYYAEGEEFLKNIEENIIKVAKKA